MKPTSITSADNPLLKEFIKLQKNRRYREKKGLIALEGPNLVQEAIKTGFQPTVVFYSGYYRDTADAVWLEDIPDVTKQMLLPQSIFKKITATKSPQEVAAIISHPGCIADHQGQDREVHYFLLLDRIQDPGNLGSIIRTAVAAGVEKICYSSGTVDPYSPKVLRATAGSIFRIDLKAAPDLISYIKKLKKNKVQVVAASSEASLSHWAADYNRSVALIVGNEAGGIAEGIRAEADFEVAIPLAGSVDSLNAAAAAAIILYEIIRPSRL